MCGRRRFGSLGIDLRTGGPGGQQRLECLLAGGVVVHIRLASLVIREEGPLEPKDGGRQRGLRKLGELEPIVQGEEPQQRGIRVGVDEEIAGGMRQHRTVIAAAREETGGTGLGAFDIVRNPGDEDLTPGAARRVRDTRGPFKRPAHSPRIDGKRRVRFAFLGAPQVLDRRLLRRIPEPTNLRQAFGVEAGEAPDRFTGRVLT